MTSARMAERQPSCPLDMTDLDGIARLGAALNERHGKLDILIGNAGLAGTSSPLGHTDPKFWDNVMAINLTANFQLIRCMEPLLQQSDAGRAVFLTSGIAHRASAYMGPYATSKAALDALVRVWANETASTPIRVNLFSPGPIRTRMRATVMPGEDPMTLDTPEQVAEYIVPMCAPSWTESGKLYDYRTKSIMTFQPPSALSIGPRSIRLHNNEPDSYDFRLALCANGFAFSRRRDADRRAGQLEQWCAGCWSDSADRTPAPHRRASRTPRNLAGAPWSA